jgi:putative phage-type endonuclease
LKMRLHAPKTFGNGLLLGTYENGSQEWHDARKGGIGGSEIGTILGLNPWESAYALWAKRSGLIPTLPVQNFAMRLGQVLEKPILQLWQERNPEWQVFTTGTYQDRDRPHLHANPDALAHNPDTKEWIVLEVKTSRNYWEQLPPQYEAQVQHYLGILDLQRAILIGLVGMDWFEQEITRDEFQIGEQRKAALAFWNNLQTGTKPDWDGSEATYNAVRAENPNIEDVAVEIEDVWQIAQAQEEYDRAKEKLTKMKSQVLGIMGSAKTAYTEYNGERITVVQRQARGDGLPFLVVKKGK